MTAVAFIFVAAAGAFIWWLNDLWSPDSDRGDHRL